ncbi:MAG: 16S rRNA (uracil(1498)-N(3))-methyltransferase [Candidatus Obscuribacterales bacterium]|nr:16S rRNA (uracil(1498)-N(3))-methyltransferase [Candidatus Obscuribacterales bacterium]
MQIQRFFLYGKDLVELQKLAPYDNAISRSICLVEADLIKQVRLVLRLRRDSLVNVLDGAGNEFQLRIESIEPRQIRAHIDKFIPFQPNRRIKLEVGQSVIKGQRFEWCLEKLTELGVDRIVPIISKRCVIKIDESQEKSQRRQRWQAIIKEASEQSERTQIPELAFPETLSDYIARSKDGGTQKLGILCAERGDRQSAQELLNAAIGAADIDRIEEIAILIGPEGGFDDNELISMIEAGWKPISLGTRVLRSDTAGISAVIQIASILNL